jgi:hypothetical protein
MEIAASVVGGPAESDGGGGGGGVGAEVVAEALGAGGVSVPAPHVDTACARATAGAHSKTSAIESELRRTLPGILHAFHLRTASGWCSGAAAWNGGSFIAASNARTTRGTGARSRWNLRAETTWGTRNTSAADGWSP